MITGKLGFNLVKLEYHKVITSFFNDFFNGEGEYLPEIDFIFIKVLILLKFINAAAIVLSTKRLTR